MSLAEQIARVKEKIAAAAREAGREPEAVTLVAATKVQTSDTIRQAIAAGITACGENRVQEMTAHLEENAYAGARLHFIGHLQTNKVRQVVGRVDLLESVDSARLLQAVEAQAGPGTGHPAGGQCGRGGEQKRRVSRRSARPGTAGHGAAPCAPAGADGHPACGRQRRKSPFFCKNVSALC